MPPEEFRKYGHEIVDWIADYLSNPEQYPVLPQRSPGQLVDSLPSHGPEQPEPMDAILADFYSKIIPANTFWNHPGFMAYFSTTGSPPAILAELLISTLNVNAMLWKSSPAATELEQVTLAWLRDWLGLSNDYVGVIFDTASTSTMHAIAAARFAAAPETRDRGSLPKMTIYTSEQAHSSIEKGAMAIGVGRNNVRKVPADHEFRMRPELLETMIEQDRKAGLQPFCVAPSIGTTSTSSIDPLEPILRIAEKYRLWVHVDGAYGGSAGIIPEMRDTLGPYWLADSLVVNPHKWLGTGLDLSILYTRRPDSLKGAYSLNAEYLRTIEDPRLVNYMDYGVPLGRRFRALKLWFVMRAYGRRKLQEILSQHIHWARELAEEIRKDNRFEVSAGVPLSLVCFRYRGTDEENKQLLERINETGEFFLSHTVVNGKLILRLALGNFFAERRHLDRVWHLIRSLVPEPAAI